MRCQCAFRFLHGFREKGLSASGSGREVTTRDHDASSGWTFSEGTGEYRGFVLDNVLRSSTQGNIHFNLYVPDSYDGTKPYALFVTLPGYQGLHFQGVGINLRTEEFGFVAQDYNRNMIIAAPQLDDWGDTSAKQTIELTEYLLDAYNIDRNKVYGEGYSGGGETMSRVMGMRPECSRPICNALRNSTAISRCLPRLARRFGWWSEHTTNITGLNHRKKRMIDCMPCTVTKG